jgi:hypothetical protein
MMAWEWIMNWKVCGRKWSCPSFRCYPRGTEKNHKDFGQCSWCTCWDLNQGPPDYRSELLLLEPVFFVEWWAVKVIPAVLGFIGFIFHTLTSDVCCEQMQSSVSTSFKVCHVNSFVFNLVMSIFFVLFVFFFFFRICATSLLSLTR